MTSVHRPVSPTAGYRPVSPLLAAPGSQTEAAEGLRRLPGARTAASAPLPPWCCLPEVLAQPRAGVRSREVPSPQECQRRPRLLHPRLCHTDSPPTASAFPLQPVNFSNICFPWALAGLGWEGRVFLRIPEAALCFPLQQAGLPGVPAWQSLPLRPWELGSPPSHWRSPGSQHSIPHGREGQNLGASLTWASSSRIKASFHRAIGPGPNSHGRPISQKSPLITLDNLIARSPASLLGNPLPAQSFGPGWDKGHTVSPGGAGSRGWRKVALLAAQGPIQPGPDCPGQAGQAPQQPRSPRA